MPTTSSKVQPLTLSLADHSLQVQFVWIGDRYAHHFLLANGTRVKSVEGDGSDAWPPSPPLQQLSLENINGSDVILGVGAAGKSHWSVSVEITSNAGVGAFHFDLACRSKAAGNRCGSRYLDANDLAIAAGPGSEFLSEPGGIVAVKPIVTVAETVRWSYLAAIKTT